MTRSNQHAAYRRAGFAIHGISPDQVQAHPAYRAILRCAELAEARRMARGQAAQARETHHKGAQPA